MLTHTIRSVVSGAFVVATLASASSALAHEWKQYLPPREITHDDLLQFKADLVDVTIQTTQNSVTVTTTVPEDLPYIHQIEILLFCNDGSTSHLTGPDGAVLGGGAVATRSCEDGAPFSALGVTIYAPDDHTGEEEEVDPSGEETEEEEAEEGEEEAPDSEP